MRILGIDPGTVSFDLCLLDDDRLTAEDSIPSSAVAEKPEELAQKCLDLKPDAIIAPSGYGIPNRRFNELTPQDFFELTLVREGEKVPVLDGMKKFFAIIKETAIEILFVPGVIQLPTVPRWRKLNKIDMGTADKMCIGALSVETISKKTGKPYREVNHLVVEMGGGYNSLVTIRKGRIINGIGGTLFPGPGYINAGAMDGELAYLLGGFPKPLLFEGGAGYLAGGNLLPITDFTQDLHPEAFKAFLEGILLAVHSQKAIIESGTVYLSGRLTHYPGICKTVIGSLKKAGYDVNLMPTLSDKSKAAAQGYAVVGNGLLGGKYQPLVRHMKIDKAEGSVLDYVYWRKRIYEPPCLC